MYIFSYDILHEFLLLYFFHFRFYLYNYFIVFLCLFYFSFEFRVIIYICLAYSILSVVDPYLFLLKNFRFSTFSVFLYLSYDREGEVNGIHYHFTDVESMEKSLNNGEFLEYAKVHGNYYGTSRKSVEEVRFQILN